MNFKIFGHLALLLCWELHWLSVFDSVLQPPSVYYELSAFLCDNVFITPHPSGQMEIIPPLGPIIPPSASIIPPSGRLDLRSTASLRRDNAGLRRNNGVLRRNNFHCPSGWGVIISHFVPSCAFLMCLKPWDSNWLLNLFTGLVDWSGPDFLVSPTEVKSGGILVIAESIPGKDQRELFGAKFKF